jgi:protein-disulfide isomerase
MFALRRARSLLAVLAVLAVLVACASAPPPPPVVETPSSAEAAAKPLPVAVAAEPAEPVEADPGTAVPVTRADATRGDPLAPVTFVVFGDYQCPFTARLVATLAELERTYGPAKLRVVWKHKPLPFHAQARPAAIAAETVLALGGPKAFWRFHDLAFENQRSLGPDSFAVWAEAAGVDGAAFREAFDAKSFAGKLDRDAELADKLGVVGTPASFVNGVFISGAQPREKLAAEIDKQLAAADALAHDGVAPALVYARLSDKNFVAPAKKAPTAPEPEDTAVWRVPVGGSPVRGKPTALVTLVEFADYQCPFCGRVAPTIAQLEAEYGDRLRVAFKHEPLPFHPRAEPAAELAIEARAQKGDAGFWRMHETLFANQAKLSDADLEGYAAALGLDAKRAMAAVASHKHKAVIDRDQDLAEDVKAVGTPHFFINGRRLVGAQPIEKFRALVDEAIQRAEGLVKSGVAPARVYDAIQKDAKVGSAFERIVLPAPTANSPGKGARPGAKVVVQMFADFQCPFCKRAQPTIDALIAAFPGHVRVVFRQLSLPFHADAALAAEASMEAFAQKGEAGFWKMAERLWEAQGGPDGLARPALERAAMEAGLDMNRFRAALDGRVHRAAVEADAALAQKASITGTPGFAVNDYFVGGAQPLAQFERAVKKALGPKEPIAPETLHGAAKPPAAVAPPPPAPPVAAPNQFGAKHLVVMYAGSQRAPASVTRTKAEAFARAQEALRKAHAGARFEDLVTAYSDEPGAAQRGGDLGKFPKGAMVPEFQGAVEALPVGATSGVVETPFGFHVIVRTQ